MAMKVVERGGRVVVWDIVEARLEAILAELRAMGGEARGYRCDVSKREEVYETSKRTLAEAGSVDVLVNNAGVVSGKSFLELSDEAIERTFSINALSLFWVTRVFLPAMIERGSGHVVTVASSAGLVGVARLSDYCASKWAAVGFDESLRMELERSAPGVKTTVVCPYYINTGMFAGAQSRFPHLLPMLEEDDVAERILRAVEHDKPRLLLPPLVHLLPMLRALPPRVFDGVMTLLGVNASMDHFVGHKAREAH